jgi:gluconate kinase
MSDLDQITILYGEMGCGKSYFGRNIAKVWGLEFLEGDSLAPPEMVDRVKNFRFLPQEMLNKFIHVHLFEGIVKAAAGPRRLVVAQALYNRESRARLRRQLEAVGFKVAMVHIKTPFWRNLRQILRRPKGFRWAIYWLLSKPFFQP